MFVLCAALVALASVNRDSSTSCFSWRITKSRQSQPHHNGFINAPPIPQTDGSPSTIDPPPLSRNCKSVHSRYEFRVSTDTCANASCNILTAQTLPSDSHAFQPVPSLHYGKAGWKHEAYESEEDRRGCERPEE